MSRESILHEIRMGYDQSIVPVLHSRPVPCNGCVECCKGQAIVLFPKCGDDLSVLSRFTVQQGLRVLDIQENGDCVYLQGGQCTVYAQRPAMCRAYDCRMHYASLTRRQRRQMVRDGIASKEVFAEGRKRLASLKKGRI